MCQHALNHNELKSLSAELHAELHADNISLLKSIHHYCSIALTNADRDGNESCSVKIFIQAFMAGVVG